MEDGQDGALSFQSVLVSEPPLGGLSGLGDSSLSCRLSWRHIAPGDEQILKASVNTPNLLNHGFKRSHKAYKGNLAQGYLSGNMYLRIRVFGDHGAFGREIGKQYAILQIHDSARFIQNEIPLDNMIRKRDERALGTYGDEFHMFVDVRQVEEGPESLVASVIRPCPKNRFSQVHIEEAQVTRESSGFCPFSLATGRGETLEAVPGGEVDLFRFGRPFAEACEGDGRLVQGGAQLVDQLSREDVHDFWWWRFEDEFREFTSRLRLRVVGNPARIIIPELPLGAFQLDEVVVCSI